MIDKIGSLAECVATGLSRRRFFTNVGRGGLALAAFLVGGSALGASSCVLNGGCCGGATPYLKTFIGPGGRTKHVCCSDPACGNCYLCGSSTSCHGGGYCGLGLTLYSDQSCSTPC